VHRSFGLWPGKIKKQINADLLDYEISDKGEKSLERHMKNAQFQGMPSKIYAHFTNNGVRNDNYTNVLKRYCPEHLSSPPVFSGVCFTGSFALYVCFVDRCLSFCTFCDTDIP
jgi:hypothetical protein